MLASMTTLDEWIKEHPDQHGALAEALGIHEKSVHRYRNRSRVPTPEMMRLIYVFTDGAVDPNSFYDLPEIKPGKRRRSA